MGLSSSSTGFFKHHSGKSENFPTLIFAGNPNVGKSTLFNYLTGLHQHTGNWTGKTVEGATGIFKHKKQTFQLLDTPGAYSLLSHSPEEVVTRDTLAFLPCDCVVVICDATAPQRGISFLLQIMELCPRVILCFNLTDQAKKQGIVMNYQGISKQLRIPVIATSSKEKVSLKNFKTTLCELPPDHSFVMKYPAPIEIELSYLTRQIQQFNTSPIPSRYLAIKVLEQDTDFLTTFKNKTDISFDQVDIENTFRMLTMKGYDKLTLQKIFTIKKQQYAQELCRQTVTQTKPFPQYKADKLLTNRYGSFCVFTLLLLAVFWITISAAQYPSELLQNFLFSLEKPLAQFLSTCHLPNFVIKLLTEGMYRAVAFVVSVMLPPMAIFFPFFTMLEDFGLLPRIAFNLDHRFSQCNACGKQALTMCMGFGCNATGVMGCRIIQSPRERLIAILTNSLVPCNGRFPTIITLLTLFCSISAGGLIASLCTAVELMMIILFTVCITLAASYFLSKTFCKGNSSFYSLELPSYRVPKFGQILVRSIFDRTLFVLGRSVLVAAPAGLLLWCLANITYQGIPLLSLIANLLDTFAPIFGLDGTILLAFLLGLPANEIVIPIMIMIYSKTGALSEYGSLLDLKEILLNNHWTLETALCVLFLMLFHSPCSTTLITIYKETKSKFYTLLAFLIPTAIGILGCLGIHLLFLIF